MTRSPVELTRRLSAALFDVDGTLADTDPLHAQAWNSTLVSFGLDSFSVDDYLAACVTGTLTPSEFLEPYIGSAPDVSVLRREKTVLYRGLLSEARLAPGADRLLRSLESDGIGIGLVTSSSGESVQAFIDVLWPLSGPPTVTISRDPTVKRKPHRAPYVLAIEALAVEASDCVAFEDSAAGVRAATSSGLPCIQIVANGAPRQSAAIAHIVDFTDLFLIDGRLVRDADGEERLRR